MDVEKPMALQVHPRDGSVYVLSADWVLRRWMNHIVNRKLVKLSPGGEPLSVADVFCTGGYRRIPFGRYGNQDDARRKLAFARPRSVSANSRRITVTDPQNGRAVGVDLVYAVDRTCAIP
jgi:hypothetical protein